MTPLQPSLPFPPSCICGNSSCAIPYGYCHCGCGGKTSIANNNDHRYGYVRGVPVRFLTGHGKRIIPIIEYAAPFKIDGEYCRLIPLTQSVYCIVLESDYEWLMQWKWSTFFLSKTNSFYACRVSYNQTILMHRLILNLDFGDLRKADHKNRNTLDNRKSNLRLATTSQNGVNKKLQGNNTSGLAGIDYCKDRNKWRARTMKDGKEIHLGYFDTKEEARLVRLAKNKELHGEFVPD